MNDKVNSDNFVEETNNEFGEVDKQKIINNEDDNQTKNNINDGDIISSTKIIYLFRKQHNENIQKMKYYPNEVK